MAWKITHDLLNPLDGPYAEDNRVGLGQQTKALKLDGEKLTFRLLDDDMEHYYTGTADLAAWEDDDREGGLYAAYCWAMNDSGCTHLLLKVDDLVRLDPDKENIYRERMEIKTGPHKGWASVFS